MRYKVKVIESMELVIEGDTEEKVLDWLQANTIREIKTLNPNLRVDYDEKILSKTVYPADVTIEDYVEDIVDETWNKRDLSWLEEKGDD